jgi:hypothetical protein
MNMAKNFFRVSADDFKDVSESPMLWRSGLKGGKVVK